MQYHFEDRLTARDCKRHIPHPFVVPAGSEQIDIDFRFEPDVAHGVSNLLTLTVFDPDGFRGAGHRGGARHQVRINSTATTPGYLPGSLPAGEWTVQIDTHMIMPGEPIHYRLDVAIGERAEATSAAPASVTLSAGMPHRGPGWYRGDLHSHTNHSDAGKRTVAELVEAARAAGIDFVFLTDHNTISGLPEMDASTTPELLTAGGVELTTFWGHALCLGARDWVDWRIRPGDGGMARIAAAAYAADQVFIIAHPLSAGDPGCTGCAWRFGEMMPGNARLVEIWNGPWRGDSHNEAALALWYDWLNQGLRLAATAGSDTHGSRAYAARPGFNVIYAESLTEPALLSALRAGRLYLSAGPQLAFEAEDGRGAHWIIGDTVGQPATFTARWSGCPADAQIRLIANGRLLRQWQSGESGETAWRTTPAEADWLVVEIRGGDGEMLAVTNPIFLVSRHARADGHPE
jgi:hypothetical protein